MHSTKYGKHSIHLIISSVIIFCYLCHFSFRGQRIMKELAQVQSVVFSISTKQRLHLKRSKIIQDLSPEIKQLNTENEAADELIGLMLSDSYIWVYTQVLKL